MILKLSKIDGNKEDLKDTDVLLVNMDQVAAIHAEKITRESGAIIGNVNEVDGSVVTLANGRAFPVLETPDEIYATLPYSLTRKPIGADPTKVI